MPQPARRVFISHAQNDKSLAGAIVNYLLSVLTIHDKKEILCTSLPGHELVPGTDPREGLRAALREAQVVLGLLTPKSLERQAVMMELGAAWAFEKRFVPLLFGVGFDRIPDWIQVHAVRLDDSLETFPLLQERVTPVAQLVADHAEFPLKDAAAVGTATYQLFNTLTPLRAESTPPAVATTVTGPDPRGVTRRRVKALATSLRESQGKKGTMLWASSLQAGNFNTLLEEAKRAGVQTILSPLPTKVGGFGEDFNLTETTMSDLIGALEMLAAELET